MAHNQSDTGSVSLPQPLESSGKRKLGFQFIPVPLAIYRRRDLTPIDKCLVGRILSFGEERCFLAQETMAEELGVRRQHINERLKVLAGKGIIEAKRGQYGKSYRVASDVRYSGHLKNEMSGAPDVQMSGTADVGCPVQRTQVDLVVDSGEEKSSSAVAVNQRQPDDDFPLTGKTEIQDRLAAALVETMESIGVQRLAGTWDLTPITDRMEQIGANFEADVQPFLLEEYPEHWTNGPPATKRHVETAILRHLADPKVMRAMGRRRMYAESERRRQQAVAPFEEQEQEAPGIPAAHDETEAILASFPAAAAELGHAAGEFANVATQTSAVVASLAEIQIEASEQPEPPIEPLPASLKERLVSAARSARLDFAADALEEATITEMDDRILIDAPKVHRAFLDKSLLLIPLRMAGEMRSVVCEWDSEPKGGKIPATRRPIRLANFAPFGAKNYAAA